MNEINQLVAQVAQSVRAYFGLPRNPLLPVIDKPQARVPGGPRLIPKVASAVAGPNADFFASTISSSDPEKQAEIDKIVQGMRRVEEKLAFVLDSICSRCS